MVQNYVRPTIALLLASMACSHLSTSSVQLEAEKAALKEAADTFHSAAGSMDVDGLVSHYTTDVLLLPPGAKRMQGAEATREFLSGFAAIPGAKARFEDPRVVTVSRGGDIGYTFGDAVFSFDGPDGETVTQHVRETPLGEARTAPGKSSSICGTRELPRQPIVNEPQVIRASDDFGQIQFKSLCSGSAGR